MKKLVALLAALVVPTALACTQMAGTYTCATQDEKGNNINVDVTVAVSMSLGFPVVNYLGDTVAADNNTYNMPAGNGIESGTRKAFCTGDSALTQEYVVKLDQANGGYEMVYTYNDYMADANTLMLTETVEVPSMNFKQSNETTCTRK